MILHDNLSSGNGYKVRLLLAQLGIPFLKRSAAVRDAEKAIEALGFSYLEVVEEGAEDVVARALSVGDRDG